MDHQALQIQEFTADVNRQMKEEKSRVVRIFLLKYKCILLLTFMLLSSGQFIYILQDSVAKDNSLSANINTLVFALKQQFASIINETEVKLP